MLNLQRSKIHIFFLMRERKSAHRKSNDTNQNQNNSYNRRRFHDVRLSSFKLDCNDKRGKYTDTLEQILMIRVARKTSYSAQEKADREPPPSAALLIKL
jgi:hypothetical protein